MSDYRTEGAKAHERRMIAYYDDLWESVGKLADGESTEVDCDSPALAVQLVEAMNARDEETWTVEARRLQNFKTVRLTKVAK